MRNIFLKHFISVRFDRKASRPPQSGISRGKISYKHLFYLSIVIIGLLNVAASGGDANNNPPLESEQTDSQIYIQKLEKRVSDLEAIVKSLLEGKTSGVAGSVLAPAAADKSGEQEKIIAPAPGGGDEWSEPVVEQNPIKDRDEEARRRLTELETWKRKLDAKVAKEAEESDNRAKFHLSGKYKVRFNSRDNLNLNNASQFWQFDNSAYFDQRIQLKLEAEYGPLSSVFVFYKGNFVFDW